MVGPFSGSSVIFKNVSDKSRQYLLYPADVLRCACIASTPLVWLLAFFFWSRANEKWFSQALWKHLLGGHTWERIMTYKHTCMQIYSSKMNSFFQLSAIIEHKTDLNCFIGRENIQPKQSVAPQTWSFCAQTCRWIFVFHPWWLCVGMFVGSLICTCSDWSVQRGSRILLLVRSWFLPCFVPRKLWPGPKFSRLDSMEGGHLTSGTSLRVCMGLVGKNTFCQPIQVCLSFLHSHITIFALKVFSSFLLFSVVVVVFSDFHQLECSPLSSWRRSPLFVFYFTKMFHLLHCHLDHQKKKIPFSHIFLFVHSDLRKPSCLSP